MDNGFSVHPQGCTRMTNYFFLLSRRIALTVAVSVAIFSGRFASAQGPQWGQTTQDVSPYRVSDQSERIQVIVQSSRVLTFDFDVPKFVIGNDSVIAVQPMSPNQIMVAGLRQGVSPLGIYDAEGNVKTVDIHVLGDVRALQRALDDLFPAASIKAHALNASVILTGHVPNADMMTQVMRVSEDYFPTPINNLTVGGAQTVLLNVKIVEVSRTKLRQFGIDWAVLTGNDFFIQSVNGLIDAAAAQTGNLSGASTLRFGVIDNGTQFGAFIGALEQNNMANILDEPILVTTSGRPASLRSGGQVPIPVANGLGTVSVEFREFGTLLDFVPIVLGDGMLRLEINSDVVEIAGDLRDPVTGVPGFRNRGVNTGVTMRAGQTLALAGIIQNRRDAEVKGVPFLVDLPWVGTMFRSVEDTFNEVELVIMVTPQFIGGVEGDFEGPGQGTTAPNDVDFYFRGYLEVPRCGSPMELGPVVPFQAGQYYSEPESGYVPGVNVEPLPPTQGDGIQGPIEPMPQPLPELNGSNETEASLRRRVSQAQYPYSRMSYESEAGSPMRNANSGAPRLNRLPAVPKKIVGQTGYDVIK